MVNKKALGFVNFDGISGENRLIEIRIPKKNLSAIKNGQYVIVDSKSVDKDVVFLARIVRGPFFVPDAVSKESAFARAAILYADTVKFRPDYHGVCYAEIMSEVDSKTLQTRGSFSRPFPQSSVYDLSAEDVQKLLGLEGDMYVGHVYGYESVKVRFPSNKNAALPRNIGIFGTVGSGKTNTSQVIIEEACTHNWAVVVIDVEGEYVDMDKPSNERSLEYLFEKFGIERKGVTNLGVYHIMHSDPPREDSQEFDIRFSNMRADILCEILSLTDAQTERFLEIYHGLLSQKAQKEGKSKDRKTRRGIIGALTDGESGGPPIGVTLKDVIGRVEDILDQKKVQGGKASYYALLRKLRKLDRQGIFDQGNDLGDYSELLEPNRVSVFDLSTSYNTTVNNIVIVDLLRHIFELKVKKEIDTNVLIVIEEAHTFISKDNAKKMEETLDVLREISRRGRKRWISLCFVSQQPSHLPPEIYELCNTKIVHQTTGGKNLNAIKNSTGSVAAATWDIVPSLGQGRCLFISSYFRNQPIICNVRPCSSARRHTEE